MGGILAGEDLKIEEILNVAPELNSTGFRKKFETEIQQMIFSKPELN